jgi:hypothetical protein
MSSNRGKEFELSEVYADRRLRRPSTKRAPVDALDARAADGVAAVPEGHGF